MIGLLPIAVSVLILRDMISELGVIVIFIFVFKPFKINNVKLILIKILVINSHLE